MFKLFTIASASQYPTIGDLRNRAHASPHSCRLCRTRCTSRERRRFLGGARIPVSTGRNWIVLTRTSIFRWLYQCDSLNINFSKETYKHIVEAVYFEVEVSDVCNFCQAWLTWCARFRTQEISNTSSPICRLTRFPSDKQCRSSYLDTHKTGLVRSYWKPRDRRWQSYL